MTNPPKVEITVAIPVKDRREQMERCLRSLLEQDHPSFEILVLDNESGDGTAEACRALAAGSAVRMRVEVLPGTVGTVRNHAGELACGEYLAFTDSDCVADPGWLTAIATALRADPELGVVCGVTRPQEPVLRGWASTITVEEWTGRFESCNIAFRVAAFRASAGFDEEVGHFWEDTAAGYAVLRGGWRAAFAPDAVILHDVTYPGFVWYLKRGLKTRNMGPVLKRYPEMADDLLWGGVFLHRRDAKLLAGAAGVVLAAVTRKPQPLLLGIPYAHERLRHWRDPKGLVQTVLYDTAVVLGCARAGLIAGRLVL